MAAPPRPGIGRSVLLPAFLALVGFGVLGLFLSTFLRDVGTLAMGLGAAFVFFVAGRILAHLDQPRGYGVFARYVLTGTAFGFAGWAFLRAIFLSGPGWPWTPWWVLLAGFGVGLYRSHKALLVQARERVDAGERWLRIFHPKDVQALAVLAAGYSLVGVAGFLVLRAFGSLFPGIGQLLAVATVAYALHGARLFLAFAAEERGTREAGVIGWLKANALQNAIVVLILVAYAVFRARLAAIVPYFPLVEFGLGMTVFGFVLARLRAKMRKDGTPLATASEARDHERVVTELREADHDMVARPVTRFIESGTGKDEYAQALALSLAADDPRVAEVRAKLSGHREPPRPPPLELRWGFAAGGAMTLGLAIAAYVLGAGLLRAEHPHPLHLALLFVAVGVYAQQDVARSHHEPRLAIAIAGAGTFLLFLDFLLFAATLTSLASIPGPVWGIVGVIVALMLGVPGAAAWRQEKRLRAGEVVDARRLSPALEMQTELQKTRKRAATMALAAFIILLPMPWLAGWLGERGFIPADLPEFLDDVLAVAIGVVAAFGAAALVRFYGLTRGRPNLLAREKERRERRLALHKTMMQSIERT